MLNKLLIKVLTKNMRHVPLLYVDFDLEKYRTTGANGSCKCELHPLLKDDEHIIEVMRGLCDYIRENYNMEDIV